MCRPGGQTAAAPHMWSLCLVPVTPSTIRPLRGPPARPPSGPRPAGRARMVEPVRARERAGAAETRRRAESSSLDAATARSGSSRRIWQLGKPSQEAAAQQRSPCNLHASTGPRSPEDKGNCRFHTMNGPRTLLKKKYLQRCIWCLHRPRGQHIKHKPKFSFVCIVGALADKDKIKKLEFRNISISDHIICYFDY